MQPQSKGEHEYPGILVLGLLLTPLGILIGLRSLRASGKLPKLFPAIDLHLPVVPRTFEWVALAAGSNLLIVGPHRNVGLPRLLLFHRAQVGAPMAYKILPPESCRLANDCPNAFY
jgi:hypothetical protein